MTARRALKTTGTFRPLQELSSPTSQPVGLPEGPGLVVRYSLAVGEAVKAHVFRPLSIAAASR